MHPSDTSEWQEQVRRPLREAQNAALGNLNIPEESRMRFAGALNYALADLEADTRSELERREAARQERRDALSDADCGDEHRGVA